MVNLDAFYRVSDETNEEIFRVLAELLEVGGGTYSIDLFLRAEAIQKACLHSLDSGSDNKELVLELIKEMNA